MNKNNCFLFLCLLLICSAGRAQPSERVLGCKKEDDRYLAYQGLDSIASDKSTPLRSPNSLRSYCPYPGEQGGIASCVGWTVAYAMSIERSVRWGVPREDQACFQELIFSPCYLFNRLNQDENCKAGISLFEAMEWVLHTGICPESIFQSSPNCCRSIDLAIDNALFKYRASAYLKIFEQTDAVATKIERIERKISMGKPVIVAMKVADSFDFFRGEVWEKQPDEQLKDSAYHSVLVIGFDGRHFEMLNSYGNEWGNGGYFKMEKEAFAEYVQYGFVLCLSEAATGCHSKSPALVHGGLYGSFRMEDKQNAPVTWERSGKITYRLTDPPLSIKEPFTLHVEEVPNEIYLYLFNINPKNEVFLLAKWDTEGQLDDGEKLPNLFFDGGREHLLLFLSRAPIPDISAIENRLRDCRPEDIEERVFCALSGRLEAAFLRNAREIRVIARPEEDNMILPIILDIAAK